MQNKQQVLFIHGGEPDVGEAVYIERLKKGRFTLITEDPMKWGKNQRKFLDTEIYEVITPTMPLGWRARYSDWKIWFERHIEFLNKDLVLVGHSLGGNFLAKYLAEEDFPLQISQLHLIAASGFSFDDSFTLGIFPGKILEKNIKEIHIYHSSDDTVVPLSESETYHKSLPGSHLHVFSDRFHFLDETFPELFENIKKL